MTEQDLVPSDDEALSALLDGELSDEQAERLGRRLEQEPALAARLAELERADERVRRAYTGVAEQPLPPRISGLLGKAAVARAADSSGAHTGNVVRFPGRSEWRTFVLPAAAAAGVALVVGLLIGIAVAPGPAAPDGAGLLAGTGAIEPGTPLHEVLETVPSAGTRELGDASATPRLTFRTENGSYCRQVDLSGARGGAQTLACRRSGEWRLEVVAFTAPAEPGEGLYRTATGAASPVAHTIESSIEGAPLAPEAEQALIAREWTEAAQ